MHSIKKYKWIAFVAFMAGVIHSQAVAEDAEGARKTVGNFKVGFLKTFDANQDGAVTLQEMIDRKSADIKKHSKKEMGEEQQKNIEARMKEQFDRLDVNKDGSITAEEAPGGKGRMKRHIEKKQKEVEG